MLVDPLLELNDQGRRFRLERLDLSELGRRVGHVLAVLARCHDRVVLVPEGRKRGRLGEAVLGDRQLDDRTILGRGREGEPELFGGDLHRVEGVVCDRACAHQSCARADDCGHKSEGESTHGVRRRSAEHIEHDRKTVGERRTPGVQPEKDSRPNPGAGPRVGGGVRILVKSERKSHRFAKLRVLDLLDQPVTARDFLDQFRGVSCAAASHHASNGLSARPLSAPLSGGSRPSDQGFGGSGGTSGPPQTGA